MLKEFLPKPRSQIISIQAKLDSLHKKTGAKRSLDQKQKPKIDREIEEDVFNSNDYFSEI